MLQNQKLTFSENLSDSLFKNGHFKNVQFRKIARQVYSTVFMWAIIYGNLYCRNIVHAKTINVPWQRGQHHIIGCEKLTIPQ